MGVNDVIKSLLYYGGFTEVSGILTFWGEKE